MPKKSEITSNATRAGQGCPRLNRTLERSAKEREMETAQRTHALQVADLEHEQQLRQQQQAAHMKLDEITQRDKQKLRF